LEAKEGEGELIAEGLREVEKKKSEKGSNRQLGSPHSDVLPP